MANEITSGPGDGTGSYPLLFIIPIASPIVWAGTANKVIPTPSTDLPAWAVDIVTAGEKTDLDAGDAMFYVYIFRPNGLTNPQMIAKAQTLYAQVSAERLAWYNSVYKYPGNRIDAV